MHESTRGDFVGEARIPFELGGFGVGPGDGSGGEVGADPDSSPVEDADGFLEAFAGEIDVEMEVDQPTVGAPEVGLAAVGRGAHRLA